MSRLVVCPHCGVHVKAAASLCPHCDASLPADKSRLAATAGAVLFGLALGGCTAPPEPNAMYGAAPVEDKKDDEGKEDREVEPPPPDPAPMYGMPPDELEDLDDPPEAPAYGVAEPLPETEPEPPLTPAKKGKKGKKRAPR